MKLNDYDKISKYWKYDLRNECIAAAAAAMHPTTTLDERCIIFTIHLTQREWHSELCHSLFDAAENFFSLKLIKKRSPSRCGLASFIDVNGSKFSGADRDSNQVHCHGFLFIPYGLQPVEIDQLLSNLTITALLMTHDGEAVTKTAPGSVEFRLLDRTRPNSCLHNWIGYAQKEEVRIDTMSDFGVILPFDVRHRYGQAIAKKIEEKRDKLLKVLRGQESFKIYRIAKIMRYLPTSTLYKHP